MNIPLSPCVPENLVSRDGFSRPVPRQPAHLHTQAERVIGSELAINTPNVIKNKKLKDRLAIAIRSLKDRCVTIVSLTKVRSCNVWLVLGLLYWRRPQHRRGECHA